MKSLGLVVVLGCVAGVAVIHGQATTDSVRSSGVTTTTVTSRNTAPVMIKPAVPAGEKICGNRAYLRSPFGYDKVKGSETKPFRSGEKGLPTFGARGTDFPAETAGVIVPAGNNNNLQYLKPKTLYYFEPGRHSHGGSVWQVYFDTAFVGGYNASSGEAVLDGQNDWRNANGAVMGAVQGNRSYGSGVKIEYLTIKDWGSNQNWSVLNQLSKPGWTIEHDTIGPNLVGPGIEGRPTVHTGQDSGGGYAMNLGADSTIEYNCVTQNSQGGFNAGGHYPVASGGYWRGPTSAPADCVVGESGVGCWLLRGVTVSHNEFSANGLGDYPDPCGCVANAGKFFYTTNLVFTYNYVHNGYGNGVWGDTNNAGADIADNYIASNWGAAVMYEASYNANISGNVIIGNGWASEGAFPACSYAREDCTKGAGPLAGGLGSVPYSAIYLANSGGNNLVRSDYSGVLAVRSDLLLNNYGGILQYNDDSRFATTTEGWGGAECDQPLQGWSSTYYANYNQEHDTDATVSGTTLTPGDGGFGTGYCPDGSTASNTPGVNPFSLCSICHWYAFWDGMSGGPYRVTGCSSASSCTLATVPSGRLPSGTEVWLSTPGGCGLYDLYGTASPGTSGSPPAAYWSNCIWGSFNTQVSGNVESLDSSVVYCPIGNYGCGVNGIIDFPAGIATVWQFYEDGNARGSLRRDIAQGSGRYSLGNLWSSNIYSFTGSGGYGGWYFAGGDQSAGVSSGRAAGSYQQWRRIWHQDLTSIMLSLPLGR